jgi:radical SAM enzyme (TIGR01210 family)
LSTTYPTTSYPAGRVERDRWIVERRPPRTARDPFLPYGYFVEEECVNGRSVESVATILLTNRECHWRCVMCDLWQNTLTDTVPVGAIPAQIEFALKNLPPAAQVKLYNAGSFFDRKAIPVDDHRAIARTVGSMKRVVVESHPALVGDDCLRFRDLLDGQLEVAMGLETAAPAVLEKLNKGMTLDQFTGAARLLSENAIALRVFVMLQPPFMPPNESLFWAARSIDLAFENGARVVTLIPTRDGNGAMEALRSTGQYTPPALSLLEASLEYGLGLAQGIVTADLWDIERLRRCDECFATRVERLRVMNLTQKITARVACLHCEGAN